MATVEELVQMMNTLQGQQHASNQEISRSIAENPTVQTAVGQAVRTAISCANPRSNERQSLVDIKGLGKPPMFKGESAKFTWLGKTTAFLIAAYGSAFRPVIEWVEDQNNVSMNEALDQHFGPLGAEPFDDVLERVKKSMLNLLL